LQDNDPVKHNTDTAADTECHDGGHSVAAADAADAADVGDGVGASEHEYHVKKCVPGPKELANDIDRDLSRTLKTEKVTKDNPINSFLRHCRANLSDVTSVKYVVLGNRAAGESSFVSPSLYFRFHLVLCLLDADSIVSALVYAYYRQKIDPTEIFIPVVNIKRERFKLRTEVAYVLKKRKIDDDLLVFKDEIDLAWHHQHRLLRLVLVDHNSLPTQESFLDNAVVAVFDHHNDEGKYLGADPRVIEPVGSCATLIAREILTTHPHVLDGNTARILLAPIVIDTANFDHALARPLMSVDQEVAAFLLDIIAPEKYPKLQYVSVYFQKLMVAKYNVSNLTSEDLLRRDYKDWISNGYRYGISSVPLSFQKWVNLDGELSSHFLLRMRNKKLDLLMVMLTSFGSTLSRELVIFTDDNDLGESLVHYLSHSDLNLSVLKTEKADISEDQEKRANNPDCVDNDGGGFASAGNSSSEMEMPSPDGEPTHGIAFYIFNQNNTKLSRKALQPLIHKFLAETLPLKSITPSIINNVSVDDASS
jgi:exopolyphosphatase